MILAVFCAIYLLFRLSVVDLRVRLLPNEMVLAFAICGAVFHHATFFRFGGMDAAMAGAAAGFLSLYAVRWLANRFYGQDSLGLGDLKLMGAGGVWLGAQDIFLAMAIGAFLGMIHGMLWEVFSALREGRPPVFRGLAIPAGPGFAAGLIIAGAWKFRQLYGL